MEDYTLNQIERGGRTIGWECHYKGRRYVILTQERLPSFEELFRSVRESQELPVLTWRLSSINYPHDGRLHNVPIGKRGDPPGEYPDSRAAAEAGVDCIRAWVHDQDCDVE